MFANHHTFNSGREVDVDQELDQDNDQTTTRPQTAQVQGLNRASSTSSSARPTLQSQSSLTLTDTELSLLSPSSSATPAMRKAKMDEQRRAQLDKRKQKALAAPTVLRANTDQIKAVSTQNLTVANANAQGHVPPPSPSQTTPTYPGQRTHSLSSSSSFTQQSNHASAATIAAQQSVTSPRGQVGQGGVGSPRSPVSSGGESEDETNAGSSSAAGGNARYGGIIGVSSSKHNGKPMSRAERDMLEQGIAPIFDPVPKISSPKQQQGVIASSALSPTSGSKAASGTASPRAGTVVRIDYSDMRSFLLSPLPPGILLQCYIVRNKKGLKNKLYPIYECFISGDEKFLMAAKKRTKNKTSNYMISMDQSSSSIDNKESISYLGKVRSNFVGTEFVTYDKGVNPKDIAPEAGEGLSKNNNAGSNPSSVNHSSIRSELCSVIYESNILGSKGPRKMIAILPQLDQKTGKRVNACKPMTEKEGMMWRYKAMNQAAASNGNAPASASSPSPLTSNEEFLSLTNKTPKWNDSVGAYVLNFNGRVTQASVKNFQLIAHESKEFDPETVLLQFGRIGKDTFTMDLQYPLSPMQAFSICLTSFDYKFACE